MQYTELAHRTTQLCHTHLFPGLAESHHGVDNILHVAKVTLVPEQFLLCF